MASGEGEGQSSRPTDWSKTLEWIEKLALDNLRARYATSELIAKEAQATLTVLLAGVGGTAAYGAKAFEGGATALELAAIVVCLYLACLAALLVRLCMLFQGFPALYQEPKNLLQAGQASLDQLREAELRNLQERIEEATTINGKKSKRLNLIRLFAVASPAIFMAAVAIGPPKSTAPAQPPAAATAGTTSAPASAAPPK